MYANGQDEDARIATESPRNESQGRDSQLAPQNGDATRQDLLDDEETLPLEERVVNPKWRIRFEGYKEINALFYEEYSKGQLGEHM